MSVPEKLTQVEAGVLALCLEGLTTEEVAQVLGVDVAVLRAHLESIRKKVGLPGQAPVEEEVKHQFQSLIHAISTHVPNVSGGLTSGERRTRLLFRLTLSEVFDVVSAAEMRAEMLQRSAELLTDDDAVLAQKDVERLRRVADRLKVVYEELIQKARKGE